MSAGEWIFALVIIFGLGGLVLWAVRFSDWPADKNEVEEEPDAGMALPRIPGPQPVAGWEWQHLTASDALSLIPPDSEGTYSVRINDDSSFSVRKDT